MKAPPGARRWIILAAAFLTLFSVGAFVGRTFAWRWSASTMPLVQIQIFVDSSRFPEAHALLDARLAVRPNDHAARMLLARLFGMQGDDARCAQALAEIPFASAFGEEALLRRGESLLQASDAVGGEAALRTAMANIGRRSPNWFQAGRDLWSLLRVQDRKPELRALLVDMLKSLVGDDRLWALKNLTMLSVGRDDPRVRIDRLEKFVAANPADADSAAALGSAYLEYQQTEKGLQFASAERARSPTHPGAWLAWLRALLDSADYARLVEELPRASALLQDEPSYWRIAALAYQQVGRPEQAADCIQHALQLAPNDAELHVQAVPLLSRIGKTERAKTLLDRSRLLLTLHKRLQSDYEDWLYAKSSAAPAARLRDLAAGMAEECRALGLDDEAGGWSAFANRPDE